MADQSPTTGPDGPQTIASTTWWKRLLFMRDIMSHGLKDTTPGDRAWLTFVSAARKFAEHLDQFEKIKFETSYGTVYVSIGRSDPYPDSFSEINDA